MKEFEMTQDWIDNNQECKLYIEAEISQLRERSASLELILDMIDEFEVQNISYHNHGNFGFSVAKEDTRKANDIAEKLGSKMSFK